MEIFSASIIQRNIESLKLGQGYSLCDKKYLNNYIKKYGNVEGDEMYYVIIMIFYLRNDRFNAIYHEELDKELLYGIIKYLDSGFIPVEVVEFLIVLLLHTNDSDIIYHIAGMKRKVHIFLPPFKEDESTAYKKLSLVDPEILSQSGLVFITYDVGVYAFMKILKCKCKLTIEEFSKMTKHMVCDENVKKIQERNDIFVRKCLETYRITMLNLFSVVVASNIDTKIYLLQLLMRKIKSIKLTGKGNNQFNNTMSTLIKLCCESDKSYVRLVEELSKYENIGPELLNTTKEFLVKYNDFNSK